MAIMAKKSSGGSFTPHPEGQFAAVCADVHDVGLVEVTWQGNTKQQYKVDIYFFCGEFKDGEDGPVPLMVRERFTLTLDERGRLRPFLERWRGRKFTPDEEDGFDLEKLIGAPAFLQVSHNTANNGNVYANIDAALKLPKGMAVPKVPDDFVRICDRPPREEHQNSNGRAAARSGTHAGPGLDDIPPPNYDDRDPGPEMYDDLPF